MDIVVEDNSSRHFFSPFALVSPLGGFTPQALSPGSKWLLVDSGDEDDTTTET